MKKPKYGFISEKPKMWLFIIVDMKYFGFLKRAQTFAVFKHKAKNLTKSKYWPFSTVLLIKLSQLSDTILGLTSTGCLITSVTKN